MPDYNDHAGIAASRKLVDLALAADEPALEVYGTPITDELVDEMVDSENVIVMRELIYVLWGAVAEAPSNVRKAPTMSREEGICRGNAIGGIADALGAHPDEMVVHAARRVAAERDRYLAALVEVDTYLANDPDVWRLTSVTKAGDVLCDVLGAETIQAINASVQANLCAQCAAKVEPSR